MQIVIEIDEKLYNYMQSEEYDKHLDKRFDYQIRFAIKDGVQLPKGHGDLITKEQAIELVEFYQINPQHFNFINLIDEIKDEKPIIESDRSEEE